MPNLQMGYGTLHLCLRDWPARPALTQATLSCFGWKRHRICQTLRFWGGFLLGVDGFVKKQKIFLDKFSWPRIVEEDFITGYASASF